MRRGLELPLHVHSREEEAFYILEGELEFELDGERRVAGPGAFVMMPRGARHRFAACTDVSRMLAILAPAGAEAMFRDFSAPARARPAAARMSRCPTSRRSGAAWATTGSHRRAAARSRRPAQRRGLISTPAGRGRLDRRALGQDESRTVASCAGADATVRRAATGHVDAGNGPGRVGRGARRAPAARRPPRGSRGRALGTGRARGGRRAVVPGGAALGRSRSGRGRRRRAHLDRRAGGRRRAPARARRRAARRPGPGRRRRRAAARRARLAVRRS